MTCDLSAFRSLACAALCGVLGCGGSSDFPPPLWLGHRGDRLPASTASNVFWIEADIDGKPGPQVIVDTGAPIALLTVEAFNSQVPVGSARVATMTLGTTTLWKVPTVGIHGDPTALAPNGQGDGGIIGFTVFGQFTMSFDYQNTQVVIGPSPPPAGTMPAVAVPFSLEGGGAGPYEEGSAIVEFPASRVIVPAIVEGKPVTLLVDTGASWVGLRTPIFQSLVADGRGQLAVEANLAQGTAMTNIARVRSVEVDGAEVTSSVVAAAGSQVDALLETLSSEVGHPVDGLLGAPFLRAFYVTVDYPAHMLDLARYTSESHVVDEYRRVGIEVRGLVSGSTSVYVVQRVYPGTDAAVLGVRAGEQLVAIDGQPLFTLDIGAVDRKLRGDVGASKQLEFSDRTLDVKVDELLPLP